jgi:cell wall-associated NlpC family hydrolase
MHDFTDLIGVPFVDGGRDKNGCDCYGLARMVFKRCGIVLPDYRICCDDTHLINGQIATQRQRWIRCEPPNLPVPCLVVIRFNHPTLCNHTGVYIGEGRFIHTRKKIGVNIDFVDGLLWKRKIEGFYVPGEDVIACSG